MGNVYTSCQAVRSDKFHVDLVDRHAPFTQEVDAIVCFIDGHWRSDDAVNQALLEVGGNQYESDLVRLKAKHTQCRVGDVHVMRGGKLPCRVVLFCVVPTEDDRESYQQMVAMAIDNIFSANSSHEHDIQMQSMAFPLETGYATPETAILLPYLFCKQLNKDSVIKEIHIVTEEEDTYSKLCQTVNDFHRTLQGIQDTCRDPSSNTSTDTSPVPMSSNSNTELQISSDVTFTERHEKSMTRPSTCIRNLDTASIPNITDKECPKGNTASQTIFMTNPQIDIDSLTSTMSLSEGNDDSEIIEDKNAFSTENSTIWNHASSSTLCETNDHRKSCKNDLTITNESYRYENDLIKTSKTFTGGLSKPGKDPTPSVTSVPVLQLPDSTPGDRSVNLPHTHTSPCESYSHEYIRINKDSFEHCSTKETVYNNKFMPDETLNRKYQPKDTEDDKEIQWKKTIRPCPGDQLWRAFTQDNPVIRSKNSNKVVTFSETNVLKEIDSPNTPELVRSESFSSTEDEALDYHNIIVKKPPKSNRGLRKMNSPATIEVQYNPDVIEQKESGTYFCVICQTEKEKHFQKKLEKCDHVFCKECIDKYFEKRPVCPVCQQRYGWVTGDMPDGLMSHFIIGDDLPGYESVQCGTIVVEYDIPPGIQTEKHPNPGQPYKGAQRSAFIPNTAQGKKVFRLLQKAFDQKLTFTVGRSRTTGKDNVVTWNDIHHKTNVQGGPSRFGYPDPDYLDRIEDELRVRGITDDEET